MPLRGISSDPHIVSEQPGIVEGVSAHGRVNGTR